MITPSQLLGAVLIQKPNATNPAQMIDAQAYAFALNSTARYTQPYGSTVLSQAPLSQGVFIDANGTYSDDGGVSSDPSTLVDMGWLTGGSAGLGATNAVSRTDPAQTYIFSLRKASFLKIDFNYLTTAASANASGLRVQVTDAKSQKVLADNYGTAAQKDSYDKITSSEGLKANAGTYSIKVSFAPDAGTANELAYNFTIDSVSPKEDEEKPAEPEKTDNAFPLNDIRNFANPHASTVAAFYLANIAQAGINGGPADRSSLA